MKNLKKETRDKVSMFFHYILTMCLMILDFDTKILVQDYRVVAQLILYNEKESL